MIRHHVFNISLVFLTPFGIRATVSDSVPKIDSLKPIELHLGFEWYYTYNSVFSSGSKLPLFVSFGHANEFNQNLIYADLKLQKGRFRSQVLPAIGTFMEQNSAAEKGIFKNILEANVGFRIFRKKHIWIDAGVMGSPYSNESPFSKDQLVLTRSLSAEYVPYYLAGVRLSGIFNDWLRWNIYLLNGWQQIMDINASKSFGSKLEITFNSKNTLTCNTYIGKEGSAGSVKYGMRYFLDTYWSHSFSPNLSFISCAYIGRQQFVDNSYAFWGQLNGAMRYTTKKYGGMSLRAEYFHDPHNVVVAPIVKNMGFECFGFSFGYNYQLLKTVLLRFEYRRLSGRNGILYTLSNGTEQSSLDLFTSAITIWF
jgi:hypothetical protein